jgi:hypothetical protein
MAATALGNERISLIDAVDKRTFTDCMEQLQQAYVMSVASTLGCSVTNIDRDMHGIDVEFVRSFAEPREEVSVKAQLKSTTQITVDPSKEFFKYRFEKRQYLERLAMPRKFKKLILIVMTVNKQQATWTDCSHDYLQLRHCCYWICLEGHKVPTVDKPYIDIPTANIFNADALTSILDKIDRGESICQN